MPSSYIALLLQFHMKPSYLITLSFFMYKMKMNKCYSKANMHGCQDILHTYIGVDLWFTFFLQLCPCEIFPNVDTHGCSLHCNPIIYHKSFKKILVATKRAQIKTQYNELQRWQLEWAIQKKDEMGLARTFFLKTFMSLDPPN